MSHHYSGPDFGFPQGDARLDFTDLYAFPKPGDAGKSILIMNVHPSAGEKPRGGPRRILAGGEMNVHDQNRLPSVSRLGKGIQISKVQTGVPLGKAEVRARIVMRHGSVLLSRKLFVRPG